MSTQTDPPPVARPVASPGSDANAPSPEALRVLEAARARSKKIRKAIRVAQFNGWSTGFFAVTTLPFSFFSLTAFVMGAVLAIVTYNEFTGAKGLQRFEEKAARRLGYNQLGFCLTLILYAIWSMYAALTSTNEIQAALAQAGQASNILGPIDSIYRNITLAMYGGLILASLVFQGGTAWYYFTRIPHIRAYVRETPAWALDYLRVL